MDPLTTLSGLGLSWLSGLRLYMVLFLAGMADLMNWVNLPAGMHLLSSPYVLVATGLMVLIEFFADKVPWVDSTWDTVHTFIRLPVAGWIAAQFVPEGDSTSVQYALGILGGTVAATSHFAKASARATVNASPEPFSNWALSLFEDLLTPTLLYLLHQYPYVAASIIGVLVLICVLVIVLLWKMVRRIFGVGRRKAAV
ncbi:DUF4126 domain-containing protein [Deinococcus cellulosilyticus]|uniref:Membrane protein n=1 Tax=Deinococcus cellulosilyticus (strain DSM 18568 / NBRC 106333 / KACC 11606 / 5516J-15) TaxID=1223518 RepID=A0A511NA18_DEIC1|nr:DUF4126 domain-containing protein [Deinococcus cellulosilyticus]GEM49673.1 membrane protein [Deinococcus cellulosilyticus NBRC 106333 = KACC 11606]